MVSLVKKISDAKLIKKILRSLPERFRIKVTTIKESNDLHDMKIKELVGFLQTYEFSLSAVKKIKSIALKASKGKSKSSSGEESNDKEGLALVSRNFRKLMKNKKFKNKFFENLRSDFMGAVQDEADKKDPRGPRCYECLGYGHIRADCGNFKQTQGKALNATLSNDS